MSGAPKAPPSDDGEIARLDTVPPPDGGDAYNAPTKVGPMAHAMIEKMLANADRKADEEEARARAEVEEEEDHSGILDPASLGPITPAPTGPTSAAPSGAAASNPPDAPGPSAAPGALEPMSVKPAPPLLDITPPNTSRGMEIAIALVAIAFIALPLIYLLFG